MDDQIVENLKMVLSPMGEENAARVLAWMQQEATERALVAYCWDGGTGIFELAKPSPVNPDVTIFAMLHWEQRNAIVAFGVELREVEGKEGMMVLYHRQLIFAPKHVCGPLSAEALYNEIASFMAPEDDGNPGGAAEPDEEEEDEKGVRQ